MYLRAKGGIFYLVWYDEVTKKQKSVSLRTKDPHEAKKILEVQQAKKLLKWRDDKLQTPARFKHKLSSALEIFLNERYLERDIKNSTATHYKNAVEKYMAVCGDKLLYTYSEADFFTFMNHMRNFPSERGTPYASATIASYTNHLNSVFAFFKEKDFIQKNYIKRIGQTESEPNPIPYETYLQILEYLKTRGMEKQYNLVKITWLCAYRATEAVLCRGEDFDLKNKIIYVRNEKNRRVDKIAMLDDIYIFLKKEANFPATGRVFDYKSRHSTTSFWRRLKRNMQLQHTFHDLRKSRGNWLAEKGASMYFLHKFMRHADMKTTEKHYLNARISSMADHLNSIISDKL